jgi:hypothetical protein
MTSKLLFVLLLTSVGFAQSIVNHSSTNRIEQTANNTSASSSFPGLRTNPANIGAQTPVPVPQPANTNFDDVHSLLYAGSTTKIIWHMQPWFGKSQTGTVTTPNGVMPASNGHIIVGYDQNDPAQIARQVNRMLAAGGYSILLNWYGNRDSKQAHNLTNSNAIANYLTGCFNTTCPLRMGMMIDKGAFSGLCPKGPRNQKKCIITELEALFDYINAQYANKPRYLKRGAKNVAAFFIHEAEWKDTDWNGNTGVWATVKAYTNGYAMPFEYWFEDEGDAACWKHVTSDGCYAFMNPPRWDVLKQLQITEGPNYYPNFYHQAQAHSAMAALAMLKAGFDDNNASWGTNRVSARRCGQEFLDTAGIVNSNYSRSTQLEFVGIMLNDYEEGTAVESGIDNCLRVSASIAGNSLHWTINKIDPAFATIATVNRLKVYFSDPVSGTFYPALDNIAPSLTGTQVLTSIIPPGNWKIWVQIVGQPLMMNHLSASGLSYSGGQRGRAR